MQAIEKEMRAGIDNTNGSELSYRLTKLVELNGTTPELMELAKAIHSHILGIAASEIIARPELLEAKQQVQKMYIAGRIAKWDALFERAEKVCSALVHSIDGLRSLLSFEKSLMNQN